MAESLALVVVVRPAPTDVGLGAVPRPAPRESTAALLRQLMAAAPAAAKPR
jgi:hypothetical protein